MKLVKKWLFPILTCLIVAGAVVLPPYISHIRDNRQFFGQIHTSELDAEALPVREGRGLLERLELYARWSTAPTEIIPSFQTGREPVEVELADAELVERALNYLTHAGVLPAYLFEFPLESPNITRILLWDPADRISGRNSIEYCSVVAGWGKGSLWIVIDSESGLPLKLSLTDYNMAQWLEYQDPNTLPALAEQYFELLGLKAQVFETILPSDTAPWEYGFVIEGTEIEYWFVFNATVLDIRLGVAGWYTPE